MLRPISGCLCLILVQALPSLAETFPHVKHTQSNQTPVRSGPGEAFYVTDHLPEGQSVEVYRKKGEWYAIRPPDGSFSYVASEHVERTPNPALLRVTEQDATTRVGTRLSKAHNVAYVTLDRGEILQALGPRRMLGRSRQMWYKIAPPSGEFRWIHEADLNSTASTAIGQSEPQELQVPEEARPLTATADAPETESAAEEVGTDVQPVAHARPEIPLQKLGQHGSMQTEPIPTTEPEEETIAEQPVPEETAEPEPAASAWKVVDAKDSPPPLPGSSLDGEDFTHQLAALSLQLSRTVLQPMSQWQLAELQTQAEQLANTDADPTLQQQAVALTRRIAEFDALAKRHRKVVQQEQAQPDRTSVDPKAAFAGHGWLIPVVTSRADLPHFALTDDQGKILHFVSAQPGINLRRYMRKRVGIVGKREDGDGTKRSHVLASRVVLLERHDVQTK